MKNKIALEEHFAIDLTIEQSRIYALPVIWEKLKAGAGWEVFDCASRPGAVATSLHDTTKSVATLPARNRVMGRIGVVRPTGGI